MKINANSEVIVIDDISNYSALVALINKQWKKS